MTPKKLERYGDVLLWALRKARKGVYKKKDVVLIRFDVAALRLAEVLHAKVLDMGLHPVLRLGLTPAMERHFFEKGDEKQLTFHPPGEKELYEKLNGAVYIHAPESLTHLGEVDPKKIAKTLIARKALKDILDKREELGRFGWTLCIFPTASLAKHAKVTPAAYASQVGKACYLDKTDPVAAWQKVYRDAMIIKQWLNRMDVKAYHIESEHVDLIITPGRARRWVGVSGHNIPSFELFTSPDWRGTEGIYYADQPSYRSGNYVEGVRLSFRKGSAVKIEAEKGEAFTVKQLRLDPGACRVGEFSLTDRRFSRINRFMANTLFDENYGGRFGNCHIALGSSYSDTYNGEPSKLTKTMKRDLGFNDSALHWDLVNTEDKSVTALSGSGKRQLIYEKGLFKY